MKQNAWKFTADLSQNNGPGYSLLRHGSERQKKGEKKKRRKGRKKEL